MNKPYDIYCIPKGKRLAVKMASVEANGSSKAEKAGINLANILGMSFHHIKPSDERDRVTANFNKPETKNKV